MKTTIEIELKPFDVPNIVTHKYAGTRLVPNTYLLSEMSPEILLKMCNDFKREVFKKAGKDHPPNCGCGSKL